jgi:hypothetical protein
MATTRSINLSDEKKRDAVVALVFPEKPEEVTSKLPGGEAPRSIRFLKETVATNLTSLTGEFKDDDGVGKAIIAEDPEIDLETTGLLLDRTRRVYVGQDNRVVYRIRMEEVVYASDGSETERRPEKRLESNIATEMPLKWTGKTVPKEKAIKMFLFSRKFQIKHINGLTYDFLYAMAKDLHESKSLMFMGGGSKGNEPLVTSDGGRPYKAFLEGRIKDDGYCLILHLTDLELKEITKK